MEPIVEVKQGKLRGKITENSRGGNYYIFQGIPYAKPPLDELRFKAPLPPVAWEGIRDATQDVNVCYSKDLLEDGKTKGSEDCLFLNVYTPELPISRTEHDNKPVMVWIHGGAFISGSCETAITGPDHLLKENVVLVTVTYRLGVLGFLNFEDPSLEIPGNAGLKDMVMALKWVKENISTFGGNPNNVTIFGESAGGTAVHLLTLSPMAKDLFHRVIAQSGSALNPWSWGSPSAPVFAKAIGLDSYTEKQILEKLKALSTEELLETQFKIKDAIIKCDEIRPFGPVLEKKSGDSAFLEEDPLKIIKAGKFNKVPFMTGYNSREGLMVGAAETFKNINLFEPPSTEELVPYSLNLPKESSELKKVAEKIKKFYFDDEKPFREDSNGMYLFYTDVTFLNGIYETARQQAKTSPNPVYLYRFSFDGQLNWIKKMMNISAPGASHGDELGYIFKLSFTPANVKPNSMEDITIRRICKIWATFARNGNPNFEDEDLFNIEWKPVEENRVHFLDIGENLTVGVNPERARMEFWNKVTENL